MLKDKSERGIGHGKSYIKDPKREMRTEREGQRNTKLKQSQGSLQT